MENKHTPHIKQTLENHQVTPSEQVWERIQGQLDMDAAAFDSGNKQRFWWYAGSLLSAAAVMLFVWYSFDKPAMDVYEPISLEQNISNTKSFEVTDNQSNTPFTSSEDLDGYATAFTADDVAEQATYTPHSALVVHASSELLVTNEEVTETLESGIVPILTGQETNTETASNEQLADLTLSDPDALASSESVDLDAEQVPEEAESILSDLNSTEDIEPIESITKPVKSPFNGFYMGIAGGWYASTLLTGKDIVINDNPIQTGMRFGPSKGLAIGYVFNNISIQAEYLYNVVEGQNYSMEVEGATKNKNMSLYFDQIPVMVKLRTPRFNNHFKVPASVNIMAGAQLNILKDYQIPQERKYDVDEDIFRKNTFSLLAGAEYEVLVTKHLMVSLGVEGTLSQNFSTASDPIGDFPKHSLSAGAKGGIHYLFNTK